MADTRDKKNIEKTWDFIIIGTGIGGGTIGHALAQAGKSVLFCERGRSYFGDQEALAGDFLDALVPDPRSTISDHDKARAGRFSGQIFDATNGRKIPIQPMIGIGTGGSSALYGMVMERMFSEDFEPGANFPDATDANIPRSWPISYDDLAPYYTAAEKLYEVRATRDALRPSEERGIADPRPFSPATNEIAEHFRSRGMHPYHVPVACAQVDGCQECVGYLCSRQCKRDSVMACLKPALDNFGAEILTECEIETLEIAEGRVAAVNARRRGDAVKLHARTVILAAGAIHTPAILLRSGGPEGVSNGSGQVGRNLMRHFIDYYLVYPKADVRGGLLKQLALNDLYRKDGVKLGTIQSNGQLPLPSSLALSFRENLKAIWPPLAKLFPLIRPLVEMRAAQLRAGAYAMVAFGEDLPYQRNRIFLSDERKHINLSYSISRQDQKRLETFRKLIIEALRPFRAKTIFRAHQNFVLGHVCGTCRFGDDPATSVLDRNNRSHEISNLYVTDASFFPTSSGTNPSLTIAANALRVADVILGKTHVSRGVDDVLVYASQPVDDVNPSA